MFDNHRNLAIGTIAIGPVPATSGTAVTLLGGQGARFSANMPVTLTPLLYVDLTAKAEIAYITAVDGDKLTLLRGQEGSSALTVLPGWTIAATATAETLTDIEAAVDAKADTADLATVATSGSYADLTEKPVIPDVPVQSVAGKTGNVTVTTDDVGLGGVDNTPDVAKPLSVAQSTALALKADSIALAAVATSGSYVDLSNKPTIPTIVDATAATKGVVQLAGDLGGAAAAPAVRSRRTTTVGTADSSYTYNAGMSPVHFADAVNSALSDVVNGEVFLRGKSVGCTSASGKVITPVRPRSSGVQGSIARSSGLHAPTTWSSTPIRRHRFKRQASAT